HPGEYLLVDPRHRDEDLRLHLLEVLGDGGDRFGIGDRAAVVEVDVVDGPLEGVGERQEGEGGVDVFHLDRRERVDDVGDDVVVGQHHPLGLAGGAAGVDEGGEVVL